MELAPIQLDPRTRDFYVRTLASLNKAGDPFLVGGAYALAKYAGIERHTKDLDIFVLRENRDRILRTLSTAGYRTEVPFPHWLAKAHGEHGFIDVIYSSGNGLAPVDAEWFTNASEGEILGVPVKLCPAEEMLWSKAFIQERERFDGADIAHLIRGQGEHLNWERLLRRFGPYWRVLFSHLVTFGFVYPAERGKIPAWVTNTLSERLKTEAEEPAPQEQVCQGTTLSREQYLVDIGMWGYHDARLKPDGPMSPEEVAHWTACIGKPERV